MLHVAEESQKDATSRDQTADKASLKSQLDLQHGQMTYYVMWSKLVLIPSL